MNKFKLFLIITLGLTAFLAGYLVIKGGLGSGTNRITGTILDKFEGSTEPDNSEKETAEGVFLLTDRPATSVTNSRNKETVLYYDKNTGKVFEYDLAGKIEETISETLLPDFISSVWSPTKEAVVSLFRSQSGQLFKYYNFSTRKSAGFDTNIKSMAFSPDGSLIAYYYFSNEPVSPELLTNPISGDTELKPPSFTAGKIVISEPNGQYPKKLLDTRLKDVEISWPTKDQIVLKTPLSDLFLLTEEGKLNKFLEFKFQLEEVWSKSGKKLLFSTTNDPSSEPMLFIKTIEARDEKSLNFSGSASKCTWSIDETTIYCALPKSPSTDNIYQIDTTDNSKKLIAEPGFIVKDMLLSSLENYLIFISASDDTLHGLKIED